MKQWIIVVALLFVAAFANGQKAVFYFPAQSAELSAEQVDSIETLVASGVSIDSVAGVANQLRNTRTLQANAALALDRAEAALSALSYPTAAVGYFVARSAKASDRRVEIYFSTQDSSSALAGGAVEEGTNHLAGSGSTEDAAFTSGEAVDSAATATEIETAAGDSAATTGETGIELPDSLIWLPAATPQLELAAVVAIETPTPCECGADLDRGYAVWFYFQVVDSATTVLQAMHASKGAAKDSLRQQFRNLRAKANGVKNCIRKSRRLAKKQDKTLRFIPITRKFAEKYGQAGPDCTADDIESGEKATKKAVNKKKRRGGRFSFRRHRKPKAFRHSRWKAFVSRLACRGM